jgi:hypothetical protein
MFYFLNSVILFSLLKIKFRLNLRDGKGFLISNISKMNLHLVCISNDTAVIFINVLSIKIQLFCTEVACMVFTSPEHSC